VAYWRQIAERQGIRVPDGTARQTIVDALAAVEARAWSRCPPEVKISLSTTRADMRSFDGPSAMVEHVLKQNPLSGHQFVFRNRRGDRVKLLY
jgi:transposase